ncbi:MAG: hypothetical protein WC678_05175 [Parcubacteria group bacterium]
MKTKKTEEWQEPELDVQAMELTKMFYSNSHFSNVRGQLEGDFMKIAFGPMYKTEGELKSRTQGKKDVRSFFDSFFWVQEKIGQLERLGMHQAAQEVREALLDPRYVMLGEVDNLKNIVPVTLVMFEARLALSFLTKPLYKKHFLAKDIPRWVRRSFIQPHIFGEYATWKKIGMDSVFSALQTLYRETYWERFDDKAHDLWQNRRRYSGCYKILPNSLKEKDEETNQTKWLGGGGFTEILQAPKEEILQLLTHEEQKRTAIWEFKLPKNYLDHRWFSVGLHLFAEHPYWQKMRLPFCSSNVSFGRGAILNPGEAYNCFDEQSKRFKGTRLIS